MVNEELAFMFEAMGLRTGVDLGKVMSARQSLMAGLPGELIYGMTPSPGLSKGWDQH